jgi:hypothetical protein
MNHDRLKLYNKLPMPIKALMVGGSFALAGCGGSAESATHPNKTQQSPYAVSDTKPAAVETDITKSDKSSNEVSAKNPDEDVSTIIKIMVGGGFGGGNGVPVFKDEKAKDAVLWVVNNVKDNLPPGITPDNVEYVLDNATPQQVSIEVEGTNEKLAPNDDVHPGEQLDYEFNAG